MDNQSQRNKLAWNYRAYEFWLTRCGSPEEAARKMVENPSYFIRRHAGYLGDVKGMKVLNALGSNGRKAVPLALLGADLTVIDISEENAGYARELALNAGVSLNYIVEDFLGFNNDEYTGYFDLVFSEGGILHYFNNLEVFYKQINRLLRKGGILVLDDFHPVRKILNYEDDGVRLGGDYFESEMIEGPVAYESMFPEEERDSFPKCLLRRWTISEILNNLVGNGFYLKRFDEHPNISYGWIPGSYTIVAEKSER